MPLRPVTSRNYTLWLPSGSLERCHKSNPENHIGIRPVDATLSCDRVTNLTGQATHQVSPQGYDERITETRNASSEQFDDLDPGSLTRST